MKRAAPTARATYQERRHERLWTLSLRSPGNHRRWQIRGRRDLWRRWVAHYGATYQMSTPWQARLVSRQMLRVVTWRWPMAYGLWMLQMCFREHQEG